MSDDLEVAGVLLAAGASSRFGSNKLLAPVADGTPLGLRAAKNLLPWIDRLVVVVGHGQCAIRELFTQAGLDVCLCADAALGMGHSLRCGIAAVREAGACVLALADMPMLSDETVSRVVTSLRSGAEIVVPTHSGHDGHPVGFSRTVFPELSRLSGDRGAREVVLRDPNRVVRVECLDPGVLLDIDTPEALRALNNR